MDTNHVVAVFNRKPSVVARLASLPPGTQIRASVITLGEIEAGHAMTVTTNQARRDEYTAFINAEFLPHAIVVSAGTRFYYAKMIGQIWRKHPPARSSISTERHLVDLKVDVNDIWTACVAWEHGLTLVTQDRMERIREAAPELAFDNWL